MRFVCVVSGGGSGKLTWDAHEDIDHLRMAVQTDQPITGAPEGSQATRTAR